MCLQALQEQHMKDLQLQMLQDAGRNNHPALAGPLAPLTSHNPVRVCPLDGTFCPSVRGLKSCTMSLAVF